MQQQQKSDTLVQFVYHEKVFESVEISSYFCNNCYIIGRSNVMMYYYYYSYEHSDPNSF